MTSTRESRARILIQLGKVWERNPDLRFCQLIENLATRDGNPGRLISDCCIFHIEDEDFEKRLNNPGREMI
jgi:uncharacterized protein YihD (DUF1040 family)